MATCSRPRRPQRAGKGDLKPLAPGTLCWLVQASDSGDVPAGSLVEVRRRLGDLTRRFPGRGPAGLVQLIRDAYEVRARSGVIVLAARRVLRPISDPDVEVEEEAEEEAEEAEDVGSGAVHHV